jgi:hypothetical protein
MEDYLFDELEKTIEGDCCNFAELHGWDNIKVGYNNLPDRLFIRAGVHVWVEFKKPLEEPTRAQASRIKQLRKHGAEVLTIVDREEFYDRFK